jgi:hypothetical protein
MAIKAKKISRRYARFNGKNFMTPTIIGYYSRKMGSRVVHVELSKGYGIDDEPFYGVTFRRPDGKELWRTGADPSRCFRLRADAEAWIDEADQG